VEQINRTENQIVITARAMSPMACCPDCQHPSSRVQSYDIRSPMDLPSSGRPVLLVLRVRAILYEKPMGITYFLWLQTLIQRFIRTNEEHSSSMLMEISSPPWDARLEPGRRFPGKSGWKTGMLQV